jgi:hypothetical protein
VGKALDGAGTQWMMRTSVAVRGEEVKRDGCPSGHMAATEMEGPSLLSGTIRSSRIEFWESSCRAVLGSAF